MSSEEELSVAELHETLGNDPELWLLRADSLLRAGDIIYDNIGQPPVPAEESARNVSVAWDWFSIHQIGRMLRGMGIECLLKAAWLRAGEVLFKEEKFLGITGIKSHDLCAMYNEVAKIKDIALNPEEKEFLSRLSYAIVGARYPVPKSPGRGYPTAPKTPTKMSWNKCEHEKDTEVFRSILAKFLEAASSA